MSKIARYAGNLKAFGSEAQGLERTVFGETIQADDLTSQVTSAFLRGWGIVGPSENPSLEDFNAAFYTLSQLISYLHQAGIPEWHEEQEYYAGSVCTHTGVAYQSIEDANTGNEPPSAHWTPVITSRNGSEYFQSLNATLTALAALVGAANKLPYFNGVDTAALTDLTAVGRSIIGKSTIPEVTSYLQITDVNGYAGRLVNVVTITSSSTYTPSAGVKKIIIEACAGGGGGGAALATAAGQSSAASGGMSGDYARTTPIDAAPLAIVVGSGGVGGNGAASATAGGGTTVGSIISLRGGTPAAVGPASTTNYVGGFGVISGTLTAPANSLIVPASVGVRGMIIAPGAVSGQTGGSGGTSPLGSGADGTISGNGGDAAATGHGCGGAGGSNSASSAAKTGGNGSSGVVIIWEYA